MNRRTLSNVHALFLAMIFASYIGSTLCQHVEWHFEVGILLGATYNPHAPESLGTTKAYLEELFHSLSRRLSLLGKGRFVFILIGLHKLTQQQSSVLFHTTGKRPTTTDLHRNWLSQPAVQIRALARGVDALILLTRRTLALPNGDGTTGKQYLIEADTLKKG
ncbi:uncharacterized protein LOC119374270 [Rhipicephalus sanguineus]|uniref:uncharacterized protein LOC119374270 n=1 Tax=Rhipicephalus sanguineus TaxID=34632 RepID=UPI0018963704|nr:uncharacterized protein LOC119374270 [Rhipicephalus sanguineus]